MGTRLAVSVQYTWMKNTVAIHIICGMRIVYIEICIDTIFRDSSRAGFWGNMRSIKTECKCQFDYYTFSANESSENNDKIIIQL